MADTDIVDLARHLDSILARGTLDPADPDPDRVARLLFDLGYIEGSLADAGGLVLTQKGRVARLYLGGVLAWLDAHRTFWPDDDDEYGGEVARGSTRPH